MRKDDISIKLKGAIGSVHRGDRLYAQRDSSLKMDFRKTAFLSILKKFNFLFQIQLDSHTFKGAGNFHGVRVWYDELVDDIKDRIQDTGFEDFILALPNTRGRTDYQPLHALIERWSDTTHTFHLPCGEFTLDPVSFAAITGIACAGDSVPFDTGLHRMTADRVAYIERLLGMVPDMKGTHTIKVDSIRSYYTR